MKAVTLSAVERLLKSITYIGFDCAQPDIKNRSNLFTIKYILNYIELTFFKNLYLY